MTDASGTLDDVYLEWLYGKVGAVSNRNPGRSYWRLMSQLYSIPFNWFVHNDDNRVLDGLDLRIEFLAEVDQTPDDPSGDWLNLECSFLEMLIALARRVSFDTPDSLYEWFWIFMKNLELDRYNDEIYEIAIQEEVAEVVKRVIDRRYSRNGDGGLFPLEKTPNDQRKVELWYQMQEYLMERFPIADDSAWI